MTREKNILLDSGDSFPDIEVDLAAGGRMLVPRDLGSRWRVLFVYRGHWCPMCHQQLADFTSAYDEFRKMDVGVVAGSAETLEITKALVEELKIPFPVAYGLGPKEISMKTGAFYDSAGGYIHATGFVINPEGIIVNGVYSTLAIGRLTAKDCLGLIGHLKKG